MKSPMEMWALEVQKYMREQGIPVTPNNLAANMLAEDTRDVTLFFFGNIRPHNEKRYLEIINRIEAIRYIATKVAVN